MPELGSAPDDNLSGQSGSFGSPDPIEQAADFPESESGDGSATSEQPAGETAASGEGGGENGNSAGEDLSLSDEVTAETFEKFGKTYRMSEEDAGFSPWERFQEMKKGEDREPNALDEEILDALMMEGYYEHEFEIGSSTFSLRTVGPKTRHNSVHALNEMLAGDNLTPAMRNMLIVAEQLSTFRGESTMQAAAGTGFESKEAVRARIRFCQDLATPVLDAIGSRVNSFRDRVSDATSRSISNF